MNVCDICGKVLKNAHGLAIHVGHMHSIKRNTDLEAELQAVKQQLADLTDLVQQIRAKGGNGNGDNWKSLQELQAMPTGDNPLISNYGTNHKDLMAELKSVITLVN